jgi:hypothetical protein
MKAPGALFIAIAVVWAAVLLAVGWVLHGSPQGGQVIMLIGGGVAVTFIILGASRPRTLAGKQ